MNSFDIRDLVKAAMTAILLALAIGKFGELRDFALKEGIKAVTLHDYKPTYFFKEVIIQKQVTLIPIKYEDVLNT